MRLVLRTDPEALTAYQAAKERARELADEVRAAPGVKCAPAEWYVAVSDMYAKRSLVPWWRW